MIKTHEADCLWCRYDPSLDRYIVAFRKHRSEHKKQFNLSKNEFKRLVEFVNDVWDDKHIEKIKEGESFNE